MYVYFMIKWLLFLKIDNDLSRIDIIFKREDSDKICMSISEKIDNRNNYKSI